MAEKGLQLNDAQQAAVDIIDGPVLVVAGAGTGKTRVITERIRHLIESGVPPESILALTFTEKAAAEMLDRVNSEKTGITLDTTIATFNGFGNELLKTYGSEYGLGTMQLLGDTGQLVFVRDHLDSFELDYFAPVSNPEGQLETLANYVSELKQQLVRPLIYAEFADKLPSGDAAEKLEKRKHQELARYFDTYLKLCRRWQVIDYDDQLYLTIELLQARPNILKTLQQQYKYLLVDEFQDTNPMQSALIELLAGKTQNVMVVGDDDQSIYGWRGATLANILDFTKHYPNATSVTLIENYRSTGPILDSAYRLIQHNNPHRLEAMNKLDKRLLPNVTGGRDAQVHRFASQDSELNWVAEDIARRIKAGEEPSSIAVLARRNQGVTKAHEALELFDVPHAVAGLSSNLYDQPSVRQLLEILKAIADPTDDVALFHALTGPILGVPLASVSPIAAGAKREHEPLVEVLALSTDSLTAGALASVESWRSRAAELNVGSLAYAILSESGWKETLYNDAKTDYASEQGIHALSKFFATLKEFEQIANVASVYQYALALPTLRASGTGFADPTLDISDTTVNIMSIHRAKGLEWDTVYIIDCTEGSFPMKNFGTSLRVPDELKQVVSAADDHMAEERRLMYVAATRARQELILTHSDRHGSGGVRKPSRFLSELTNAEDAVTIQDKPVQTDLELFAPRNVSSRIELPINMFAADGELVLSVSQIEDYLRCPQDFYYKHVLGMPQPPAPQLEYGSLMHGLIEQIHRSKRQGIALPDLKSITEETLAKLPRAGYATARSRDRSHAQAAETITRIYERFSAAEPPVEVEQSFAVKLADIQLTIKGRIDAVYSHGNGVEIRDFKTGTSVSTPEKAKQRATASTQLTLYALAWQQLHDEMPQLLSLDFVETGQVGSVRKQPKSLVTLSGKLQVMFAQLQSGKYPPGDHTYCQHPLDIDI